MRTLSYAAELSELLEGFGLTEAELARGLGTTTRTLRRWATEEALPHPSSRERIEDLMQVLGDLRRSVREDAIPKWVRRRVDLLEDRRPADLLARGDIEALRHLLDALRTGAFV